MTDTPTTAQTLAAEALGTFVLVLFGCGAALMSGGDYVATGLTFGLTVVVMAYAVGRFSGGHFNPAVSVGAAMGGRIAWSRAALYVGVQLAGGILAGLVLFGLVHGFEDYDISYQGLAQNSFGDEGSGFAWWAAFLIEFLFTAVFLWVILAVTDSRNDNAGFAPLTIGLALAMIHFASMGATGTSVNPARSIGVGLFAGTDAIIQLWLFILAPLLGGAVAGLTYPLLFGGDEPVPGSGLRFGTGSQPAPDQFQLEWNQEAQQAAAAPAQQQWQQPPAPQPGQQQWQQPAPPAGQQPAAPQQWQQPQPPAPQPGQQQWQQPPSNG